LKLISGVCGEKGIVMEYINGGSVKDIIAAKTLQVDEEKAVTILRDVAVGMIHLVSERVLSSFSSFH
jgi:predicted unusual protein kinase regulating ubiquinone biosynthesis (AarF/ABC1/UbiB family)